MGSSDSCQWDVVVVGASFAGAACALAARRAGLRVCVMERKRDPGLKLHTTGIIVKEAAQSTALSCLPAALVRRVPHVRLYAPNLRNVLLHAPAYHFLTTDTPNVMRWLVARMLDAGIEVRLMHAFTDAHRAGDGWQVAGLGRTRWLVGADGAKSRVALRTGLGGVRDFLYGVEHEFDGATLAETDALHCFIDRRLAPGYLGWAAQTPTGVQLGLAFRHRPSRTGVPDLDALRGRVGARLGIAPNAHASAIRAGLIPCGGRVAPIAAPGVILTGDAAGIVSPLTAGGIHAAWRHGDAIGDAIARFTQGIGPAPERVATAAAPRHRLKRLLRWSFDYAQMDWPFNLALGSVPMRWMARQIYFRERPSGPA